MKRSTPVIFLPAALSLTAFVCVAARAEPPAPEAAKPANGRIGELLPKSLGGKVCYTGQFSKRTVEIEDWSNPKQVPVPGLIQFGKQVMRPEPEKLADQEISSLTLLLAYDDRSSDYDWIYNFTLRAAPVQLQKELLAAGECPWYEKDKVIGGVLVKADKSRLGCGIDCDGGLMAVVRDPSSDELLLSFDGSSGLRMSAGCGGGGSYRVGTGEKDGEAAFLLKKADTAFCKPLEDWLESE